MHIIETYIHIYIYTFIHMHIYREYKIVLFIYLYSLYISLVIAPDALVSALLVLTWQGFDPGRAWKIS